MISRRSLFALVPLFAIVLAARGASAAIPSPSNSTVDPCLRVCPAGDMTFHVVVRDIANNPVSGSTVAINLCNCPGVVLCPPGPNDGYAINGCSVLGVTNAAGVVDFNLRAGGTCNAVVQVLASGVLLANVTAVSSPDQNGDLAVTATDAPLLAAKIGGPYDATGDLNCSGAVEPGDSAILAAHIGHSCQAVVPVMPRSWGTIKSIYYR